MSFGSALKAAADQSHAAGQINSHDHAALVNAASDPHLAPAAEAAAAWSIGQTIGSVDWVKLIGQLQTVLPFVLQLIALFSKQPPAPTPAPSPPSPPAGAAQ